MSARFPYTQLDKMLLKIKELLVTDTGKDTSVVFLGTVINIAIGGVFFILAPRILGPESYGLFAVVMATGLMATNFANFGIDTGILRFLKPSANLENQRILKLAFKSYLLIGTVVAILGFSLSPLLAKILGHPDLINLLRISFAGVIFILISNFFTATLQSQKQFAKASLVNISSNVARLVLLMAAVLFFTLDLYWLTIIFFSVTIVSIVIGKLFVPFDFLKAQEEHVHFKNFFGYNFWIAASLAISSIPVDNYLLVKIAGPLATGLYAAPMKFLTATYQFAGGFSRVLAPRFASFDSDKKAKEFSLKASGFVAVVFAGLILLSFLAGPITTLFGSEYEGSIVVFQILSVGMAFFFADTIPMALILYYFGKSKVAFYITVWHYLIYTFLLFVLISRYSEVGAAIAFTVSEIITFLTLVTYILLKFRKSI